MLIAVFSKYSFVCPAVIVIICNARTLAYRLQECNVLNSYTACIQTSENTMFVCLQTVCARATVDSDVSRAAQTLHHSPSVPRSSAHIPESARHMASTTAAAITEERTLLRDDSTKRCKRAPAGKATTRVFLPALCRLFFGGSNEN